MTESEQKFEFFCSQSGLSIERIVECTEKRPDYYMHFGDGVLVTEVKQIDPGPEETALLNLPLEDWNPEYTYHWGIPGERIRAKIKTAVPQLRMLSHAVHPTMLVLYNTVNFWPELLDADALKVAMYGIETALISPTPAPTGGATILARWHGQRRRLTRNQNTTLSAVGILSDKNDKMILEVFHNFFASIPLSVDWLSRSSITQFQLSASPEIGFPTWCPIVGADADCET